MALMDKVSELLKRVFDAGLTQSEVARQTQIPQPRISKWAAGMAGRSANDALVLREYAERLERQTRRAGKAKKASA